MKLLLYFLFCKVIILTFWLSYISYTLTKLQPDHLHAYTAALGAFSGVLMIAVKILPLLHKSSDEGTDDGGE